MNLLMKGVVVAALHLAIVLSLGGKLLYDRAHRPRVWVRTGSVDPDEPIRGRYFTLSLEVRAPEFKGFGSGRQQYVPQYVRLAVENGRLMAYPSEDRSTGTYLANWGGRPVQAAPDVYLLNPGVTFFIAEHAETPRLNRGDELWAEVTVPKKGPPRPIQLAIKRGTEWIPLTYR